MVKIRTRFGEKMWVSRDLTVSKLLTAKDIPEPLYLLVCQALFKSCKIPIKSLDLLLMTALRSEVKLKDNSVSIMPPTPTEGEDNKDKLKTAGSPCEMQEAKFHTIEEFVRFLNARLQESQSESRSKKSDYELPSETIWGVRVLPFCRLKDESGRTLKWRWAFELMRQVLLSRWKRSIYRSVLAYRDSKVNRERSESEKEAIQDCLLRVSESSLSERREAIRNGFPLWLRPVAVNWRKPQPKPGAEKLSLMKRKIQDIRDKGYVQKGNAKALIRFFEVPKGESDIRMVYGGTKSGLNAALWAPGFPLPTASSHLRILDRLSWMADNDAGEFFLNWMMDERVQKLCGIDLTHFVTPEVRKKSSNKTGLCIEVWKRCTMGLRPSPYVCVKGMLLAKEIILGNQHDSLNVFCWDHVLLNLPGMEDFDSSKPWVSKRRRDGSLAADLICFVDDLRPVAPTEKECWEASQVVSKTMARLGLQDASRKRNPPSKSPGPWAGIVVTTDGDKVHVSVSQKKWDRARAIIKELTDAHGSGKIQYKSLESKVGYLVYVAQAYPALNLYLPGFYATLNSWRPNWDDRGWKIVDKGKRRKLNRKSEQFGFEEEEAWQMNRFESEEEEG